ncbi:hypothetical protein O0I10_010023 [Lichtheimia ornata]|uniref:Uncharacterized protein n=1 Tax=Lichtheimia ornata TaxID=688661 RepID=A0AAD7UVV0_9FUNG|nr:uncharacterized protein O0I10_010023 [Lichtheimia ornata]KAJ8654327.1 hypothetical protein O0I10_010023 [Lichtheimia ornata]
MDASVSMQLMNIREGQIKLGEKLDTIMHDSSNAALQNDVRATKQELELLSGNLTLMNERLTTVLRKLEALEEAIKHH